MYRFGLALPPARADTRHVASNVAHVRIRTCTCRCCTSATWYPYSIPDIYKAHIMHRYLTRNEDLLRRPHLPGTAPQSSAPREAYLQSAAQCPLTTLLLSADCAPGLGLGLPFSRHVCVCVRMPHVAVNRLGNIAAQEHPVLDGVIQWATQFAALASIQWRPQIADLHLVNPTYFALPFSEHPKCIW